MGRDFVIAGIFLAVSSFVLYIIGADLSIDTVVLIETILLVAPIILIIIRGVMHLKAISED